MNGKEVLELLEKACQLGLIAYPILISAYVLPTAFAFRSYKRKIESKDDLEKTLNVEAEKLEIDPRKIDVFEGMERTAIGRDGSRYILYLRGIPTVMDVRHELYHAKKDNLRKGMNILHYGLIQEPRAILYAGWNIKL